MLDFVTPKLQDREWIQDIVAGGENRGSDLAFGNLYLLRNKYDTKICRCKDFLIRKYNGLWRSGYTFPVGEGDVADALHELEEYTAEKQEPFCFCMLTEEQKNLLEELYPNRFAFSCNEGDTDYVYLSKDLAELAGRAYHKKKNHVLRFFRTYENVELRAITEENKEDAWTVEERWHHAHQEQANYSQMAERNAIWEALQNMEGLGLMGAVLYVEDVPAGMTIASRINRDTCDIHFEKVNDEYAVSGGYSVINQLYAKQLVDYEWINREEDIGIEGLRKAKLSYHPKLLIPKYSARSLV